MTSIIKTAVVGAVAAAFVASVAIAQQGTGEPQRRGPGFGQGRMGMGPGGPGARGFGGPGLMGLDLTQEQRDRIKAIHEANRPEQGEVPADAKLRQQLELELFADALNDVTIENLKQQIAAAQLEHLARHVAVKKQVNQVLTAEQRATARQRISEGPKRGPGAGRGRGRGFGFGQGR